MGTSANLAIFQGDRHLILHVSHDAFVDNVLASIAAPIVAGGLDVLRQSFASATIIPEDQADDDDRAFFRTNAAAYIAACEARGRPVFDLDGLLNYKYGTPDFSHHGGGLIFGPRHVNGEAWVGNNPRNDADFILDLDAGHLFVNYDPKWCVDLNALDTKDADAVFDFLSTFDFDVDEDDVVRDPLPLSSGNPYSALNRPLNEALSALPDFDPQAIETAAEVGSPITSSSTDVNDDTVIYRFHPEENFFVRLLSQAFQQAAIRTGDPNLATLVSGLQVENASDHCGLVLQKVPVAFEQLLSDVGDHLIKDFGAIYVHLSASGGVSVRHSGGGYSSSGSLGIGSIFAENDDESPDPATLTPPLSMEERAARRQQWIDAPQDADVARQALQSELWIALVSFDVQAYTQIMDAANAGVISNVSIDELDEGSAGLASSMAKVEDLFNREGLRERFGAMPSEARALVTSNFDLMARHQFDAVMGLSARKPKV